MIEKILGLTIFSIEKNIKFSSTRNYLQNKKSKHNKINGLFFDPECDPAYGRCVGLFLKDDFTGLPSYYNYSVSFNKIRNINKFYGFSDSRLIGD